MKQSTGIALATRYRSADLSADLHRSSQVRNRRKIGCLKLSSASSSPERASRSIRHPDTRYRRWSITLGNEMQQIWNSNQPFCWMVIKSVANPYNSSVD